MIIREAVAGDLPQLLELYTHLHDEPPLPANADTERLWQSLLGNPALHCFVAEDDGRLISTCTMVVVPNLTRGGQPYGLIENVVTRAAYRQQGFGTQVLEHALGIAWGQNCYKVMLLTSRTDEAILHFYEKCGFVRGVKTGFIAKPPVV